MAPVMFFLVRRENFTLFWLPCLVLIQQFELFIHWWQENRIVSPGVLKPVLENPGLGEPLANLHIIHGLLLQSRRTGLDFLEPGVLCQAITSKVYLSDQVEKAEGGQERGLKRQTSIARKRQG